MKKDIEFVGTVDVEFCVDISETEQKDAKSIILRAAEYVLKHEETVLSVNIVVVDDMEIQRINREFRNIDRATDVLSFPASDGSDYDVTDGFLGDIAISYDTTCRQAEEYGHSVERELAFLTVHGMLHIMGYDHIEKEDEAVMFALQKKLLDEMGLTR